MNFKEYIELHRKNVYAEICRYLPIREPEEHYRIIREYTDRQGGYRRPGLLMLSGELFGAGPGDLLLPAAAMQLSEDWMLIHDDVEDDSELRRGKPTLHRMYGYEHAVNAGDGAQIAMWRMLKDYIKKKGMEEGERLYEKFYDMLEKTVEGQYMEIKFTQNNGGMKEVREELYFRIVGNKTCYYTVYGPMQLGAIVAKQKDTVLAALKEIGYPAGVSFQIIDDILDFNADEKTFGKQRYGDLYEGKITLLLTNTYKNASENEKAKMAGIYSKKRREKSKDDVDFIAEMINKYDGVGYASGVAKEYMERAKVAMEKNSGTMPENEYKKLMLSAISELFTRKK